MCEDGIPHYGFVVAMMGLILVNSIIISAHHECENEEEHEHECGCRNEEKSHGHEQECECEESHYHEVEVSGLLIVDENEYFLKLDNGAISLSL